MVMLIFHKLCREDSSSMLKSLTLWLIAFFFFPPLPCWGTVLKVAFFLLLKLVTLFPVTGWESYLVRPESLFDSKIVRVGAWKQSFTLLWMIHTRKCDSQLLSVVYVQPDDSLWKWCCKYVYQKKYFNLFLEISIDLAKRSECWTSNPTMLDFYASEKYWK